MSDTRCYCEALLVANDGTDAVCQHCYDQRCAEIADLKARLERAERERDEARQLINALEKSAEKYEAWVDENMRMI